MGATRWALALAALTLFQGCLQPSALEGGPAPFASGAAVWPALTLPRADPALPPAVAVALDAARLALDALPWATFAAVTDPLGVGNTFAEFANHSLRRFAVAAQLADALDGGAASSFHAHGHPAYNGLGARVEVRFPASGGRELAGTLYLPRNGTEPPQPAGAPAIVAMEGVLNNRFMYQALHLALADVGYLVFAFDFTGQGESEGGAADTWAARVGDATAAMDWLLETSPVAPFVDPARVGTLGHSMGAITALEHQARDARVRAVVALDPIAKQVIDLPEASKPIMLQTGDHDGPIAPLPLVNPLVVRPLYESLQGDKELIVTEAATHGQHDSYPLMPKPTWSHAVAFPYIVAWFDIHVRGEAAALEVLTRPVAHLSALHASEYDIGGQQGRLAGALPAGPSPAPGVPMRGTAEGVRFVLAAGPEGGLSLRFARSLDAAEGALEVGPDGRVRLALPGLGSLDLVPPRERWPATLRVSETVMHGQS